MFQVLSRHSEGSSGILPGISFCFCRPCYSPYNVCCLAWLWFQYVKFVWWFLKRKADGWSGGPASSWDLLSPWRITLYSLIPGNSALKEPSWLPGGLHAVGTPSMLWEPLQPLFIACAGTFLFQGGPCCPGPWRPSHHRVWGNGFLQLACFILCLWNFLFHKFVSPSELSLNKI